MTSASRRDGDDKAWFAVYTFTLYKSNDPNVHGREVMRRGDVLLKDHGPSNVVLVGIHPVTWASRQPIDDPESSLYYVTTLLFFAEIPEEVVNGEVEGWTEIQRFPMRRNRHLPPQAAGGRGVISARSTLGVWLLLSIGNYIAAALFDGVTMNQAGERSAFQLLAVLAVWWWSKYQKD